MSEADSSNHSGEVEYETRYVCRHCPGKLLTADQLKAHRATHPKSKKKKSEKRRRDTSPNQSEVTLFQEVQQKLSPAKKKPKGKPRKKRESKKNYDQNVQHESFDSG